MNKKLPARALFYAISVAVLVAFVSGAMLLSSYHQHMLMGHYQIQERLLNNCQSGVELILGSKQDSIPKIEMDLFGKERDSICLEQKAWGLLDVAFVKSWSRKDSFLKSFFVGKQAPDYALTLLESNQPLYLCGDTRIVGNAFLPTEGVERNFIQGKPYTGKQLIDGKTEIVKLQSSNYLKSRFSKLNQLKNSFSNKVLNGDSIKNNFDKQKIIIIKDNFNTAGFSLKGNIVLVAKERIELSSASEIEDIIVIAPKVVIKTGFRGSIQAYATDSLIVESEVILDYPSVLGLLPPEKKLDFSPKLEMQSFSQVTGVLIVPSFTYSEYQAKVTIHPNTFLKGQAWINGYLEHRGILHGSLLCKSFSLNTAAAVYENYLLDAVIDRKQLPRHYLAPPILGLPSEKAILKIIE